MGAICVSAGIADVAMNLTLALANPTQIRNVNTKVFAESGKPRERGFSAEWLMKMGEHNERK